MRPASWATWRRDLLVGVSASMLTASVLVPVGWTAVRDQRYEVEAARRMALESELLAKKRAAEAGEQRIKAERTLLDQAIDFAGIDRSETEVMQVTTKAVVPEVPEGAHLLIDKKATAYAVGDIVIFRAEGRNYLGRIVTLEKEAGFVTLGRNGEASRRLALKDLVGRGVLNTR